LGGVRRKGAGEQERREPESGAGEGEVRAERRGIGEV